VQHVLFILEDILVFKRINAKNFLTVPFLETSQLMRNHQGGVEFSTEKPNAIVGPNGAGKSALLKALSLHSLSWFTGVSAFDSNYLDDFKLKDAWRQIGYRWEDVYEYLGGLEVETDYAPALYHRPGHIPGNERMIAAAMMVGYGDEAMEYGRLTRHKSSGQQCSALLDRIRSVLSGDLTNLQDYATQNGGLGAGAKSKLLVEPRTHLHAGAVPVLLMDEPEQSLDAKAELEFWHQVAEADLSKMQAIIATHSLYPLMHPEKFHIIEAVPHYAQEVSKLLL
jgi:ABC-type cobalamin/Fe3+-siderophores transport system ATPase subunit